ncbi:unnamed protein product, partial [Allacma fusca]
LVSYSVTLQPVLVFTTSSSERKILNQLHNSATNPVEHKRNSADNKEWIPQFWSYFSGKFTSQVNLSHLAAKHELNTIYLASLCFFKCNGSQ